MTKSPAFLRLCVKLFNPCKSAKSMLSAFYLRSVLSLSFEERLGELGSRKWEVGSWRLEDENSMQYAVHKWQTEKWLLVRLLRNDHWRMTKSPAFLRLCVKLFNPCKSAKSMLSAFYLRSVLSLSFEERLGELRSRKLGVGGWKLEDGNSRQ